MPYYDTIDIPEGIDFNKTNATKNVLFVNIGTFQTKTLVNIPGVDYYFIIAGSTKNEAINLLKNAALTEKSKKL